MFADRSEAGRKLAEKLSGRGLGGAVVIALPRGGLPVGAEIARAFSIPLDVLFIRKVGAPGQPELAVGAVSDGGSIHVTINSDIARHFGLSNDAVRDLARRELPELERRHSLYADVRVPDALRRRRAILVDDGAATGASVRAAIGILKERGMDEIVVALPVAPSDLIAELGRSVSSVICLETPSPFNAVGASYSDFHQLDDNEALEIMKTANAAWLNTVSGPGQERDQP